MESQPGVPFPEVPTPIRHEVLIAQPQRQIAKQSLSNITFGRNHVFKQVSGKTFFEFHEENVECLFNPWTGWTNISLQKYSTCLVSMFSF